MYRLFVVLIVSFVLSGCSDVFTPEIKNSKSFMVVEGSLTTKPGKQYIFLNNSSSYTSDAYFSGISDVDVSVIGQNGKEYHYTGANGVYQITLDESSVPKVGETYFLRLVTPDGKIYESTPQTIAECPEISKLYCQYNTEQVISEDDFGKPVEINKTGLDIYFETQGILPSSTYFIYDYIGFGEYRTTVMQEEQPWDIYGYNYLPALYQNMIHAVSASDYSGQYVKANKLMFLAQGDLAGNPPAIPEDLTILHKYYRGLVFRLRQFSISADAYKFYSDAENQLNAEGRLFDPVAPKLYGNVKCVSDSTSEVLGVFYAADVKEKSAYFYLLTRNVPYTKYLDSLPNINPDTLFTYPPDGWIEPPR